jgi:hypothetical protein
MNSVNPANRKSSLKSGEKIALLSQKGSGIAKRHPTSGEGGWFQSSNLAS